MAKFPVDAPLRKVVRALGRLGFRVVRDREHISMLRRNSDGTTTPLTLPSHPTLKSSTLRAICTQAGIARDDFQGLPRFVALAAAPGARSSSERS